jgi:hypothetical protein
MWFGAPCWLSAIAIGLFLASLISNIRYFRYVKRRENLKKDASAVEGLEVSASRVLDLEPMGDNAPALCFFVGEGKALLLVGQWLERDSFPAESFRLHRWADTKEPVRTEVTGRPLEAEHSTVQLRPSHKFGRIEMLDATLKHSRMIWTAFLEEMPALRVSDDSSCSGRLTAYAEGICYRKLIFFLRNDVHIDFGGFAEKPVGGREV